LEQSLLRLSVIGLTRHKKQQSGKLIEQNSKHQRPS
jgi:hypothetical protein